MRVQYCSPLRPIQTAALALQIDVHRRMARDSRGTFVPRSEERSGERASRNFSRTPFSNGRDKWRANDRSNRTTDSFVI